MLLQILAITLDNTSNNNTLIDELGELLDGFQGSLTRVRCFAHILNLVVKVCIILSRFIFSDSHQSILSQFSHKTSPSRAGENATEHAEDDAAFEELEDDVGDDDVANSDEHDDDSGDEIDGCVAESNDALVDAVASEVSEDVALPTLSHAELNLGKFAVTKVNHIPIAGI